MECDSNDSYGARIGNTGDCRHLRFYNIRSVAPTPALEAESISQVDLHVTNPPPEE